MLICHFSDWHGKLMQLPAADVYVCTGDMLPNFLIFHIAASQFGGTIIPWESNMDLVGLPQTPLPMGVKKKRVVSPDHEEYYQRIWLARQGDLRRFLGNRDAPIIFVRGNHDYVDLAPAWGGKTWEVDLDVKRTYEFDGLKFGGMRGIPYIIGEWNDEEREFELWKRQNALPRDIDVLVTHVPPFQILDLAHDNNHYGAKEIRTYVDSRVNYSIYSGAHPIRAHLFGHVHGGAASCKLGDVLFSNAATGYILHEI